MRYRAHFHWGKVETRHCCHCCISPREQPNCWFTVDSCQFIQCWPVQTVKLKCGVLSSSKLPQNNVFQIQQLSLTLKFSFYIERTKTNVQERCNGCTALLLQFEFHPWSSQCWVILGSLSFFYSSVYCLPSDFLFVY